MMANKTTVLRNNFEKSLFLLSIYNIKAEQSMPYTLYQIAQVIYCLLMVTTTCHIDDYIFSRPIRDALTSTEAKFVACIVNLVYAAAFFSTFSVYRKVESKNFLKIYSQILLFGYLLVGHGTLPLILINMGEQIRVNSYGLVDYFLVSVGTVAGMSGVLFYLLYARVNAVKSSDQISLESTASKSGLVFLNSIVLISGNATIKSSASGLRTAEMIASSLIFVSSIAFLIRKKVYWSTNTNKFVVQLQLVMFIIKVMTDLKYLMKLKVEFVTPIIILLLFASKWVANLMNQRYYFDFTQARLKVELRLYGLEMFHELHYAKKFDANQIDPLKMNPYLQYCALASAVVRDESNKGYTSPFDESDSKNCTKFIIEYVTKNLPLGNIEVCCFLLRFKLLVVFDNLFSFRIDISRLKAASKDNLLNRLWISQLFECMDLRFAELYKQPMNTLLNKMVSKDHLHRLLKNFATTGTTSSKIEIGQVLDFKNKYLDMVTNLEHLIQVSEELFQYLRQNNKIESNTLFKYNQVIHSSNTKIDKMIHNAFDEDKLLPTYYYTSLILFYSVLRGETRKSTQLKSNLKFVINRLESAGRSQKMLDFDSEEMLLRGSVVFTTVISQGEQVGRIRDISADFMTILGQPNKPVSQLNLNDWLPGDIGDIHKKMMIKESANFPKVFNKQIKFFIETYDDVLKEIESLLKLHPNFNEEPVCVGALRESPPGKTNQYTVLADPDLNIISADEKFWQFIDSLPHSVDLPNLANICPDIGQALRLQKAVEAVSASVLPQLLASTESRSPYPEIRNITLLLNLFEVSNNEQGLSYSFCTTQGFRALKSSHLQCSLQTIKFGDKELLKILCTVGKDSSMIERGRNAEKIIEFSKTDWKTGSIRSLRQPHSNLEYLLEEFQLQGHSQRKTV